MAFSDLLDESLDPMPIEDQMALIPDMTLRTLDTEWMESLSPLECCGLLRKET